MKNSIIIAAIAAITLSSCKKQIDEIVPMEAAPNSGSSITGTDNRTVNESLDKAALVIATSLDDAALRSYIKTEAMKQFDGDYDILYKSAKSTAINGRTLESIFSASAMRRYSGTSDFQSIISNVSNFQISVPVNCENWNSDRDIPLVAISPTGVNEKSLKQIKAYDSKGNVHYLDATVEPSVPVIVVGVSERVDENGILKYQFENTNAARTNGQNTILSSLRCTDLGAIENWINGKPELRLRIYGAKLKEGKTTPSLVQIASKFYNPKRSDIDGVSFSVSASLFHWYRFWSPPTTDFVYGSQVKFYWVEEDGGSSTITVAVNIGGFIETSTGSVPVSLSSSFSISDVDDYLGNALVKFSDPSSYVYTVGVLEFELD